jgi:hypothetical protein
MAEGGATRKAMECLCLRLFRRQDKDSSLVSSHSLIPVPQPGDKKWWAFSMVRRVDSNFSALVVFGPVYLVAGSRRGILSWLSDLSSDASSFLQTYDLGCVEELVVWPPLASGGRPSRGVPYPLPWLLSPGLRPGGPEVHSAIASLLLREGECIPRSIPVIRKQTYQFFPTSFFCVALPQAASTPLSQSVASTSC